MALKKRKGKYPQVKAKKMKPAPKETVVEEDHSEEDMDSGSDGFDDMGEIPLDVTHAAGSPAPASVPNTATLKKSAPAPAASSKSKRSHIMKPPTSQEMNALRETENLFHSNLFKLQAEDILTEIRLKPKRKLEIDEWLKKFKDALTNIPNGDSTTVGDTTWLSHLNVKCPFSPPITETKSKFCYLKPSSVNIVGSWPIGLASKVQTCVDVDIVIPSKFWEKDDHLDYRYHLKRALYLSHVAGHLRKLTNLIKEIQFDTFEADSSRPLLLLQPEGKLNQRVTIRLFASPAEDFVAIDRLLPHQSCLSSESGATPLYNTTIVADMQMLETSRRTVEILSTKKNMLDALLLLRLWLRHRQLDGGSGAFSMFILTQFVVYLCKMGRIQANMSHYQVLRTVWLQLSRSDWTKEGISLAQQEATSSFSVPDAHASFSLVFLDSTGSLNFCANVSTSTYNWLRWEATLAVGLLNERSVRSVDSFGALFKTPKPFLLSFDNVVVFDNVKANIEDICQCLSKGLGQRVKLVASKSFAMEPWSLDVEPKKGKKFALGFCFNTPAAWEMLEKGPPAENPESAEFRAFWGKKSELRRFQDGFVCEAVHWGPAKTWAQRRLICRSIISYLLENRLAIGSNDYTYVADQLDSLLSLSKLQDAEGYGTGEEACRSALEALDGLTKNLRNVDELPLIITMVQGTAATFRYAETFPPLPQIPQGSSKLFGHTQGCLTPSAEMTPMFLPSLKVLLTLETSGKWPDELEAVKRVKAAFYLKLAERLHKQFQLVTKTFADGVIVVHEGYVFHLVIAYQRDIAMLKRSLEGGLIKYRDNAQSQQLERDIVILPRLSAALRGLQAQHPAFSCTVRLAKRWIASHMLLDYIEEEAIEMIVASLFIDANMYGMPQEVSSSVSSRCAVDWAGSTCPQVAFLRFLQIVSRRDWHNQPLLINFGQTLSSEELKEMDRTLLAKKEHSKAVLVLATPYDHSGTAFTQDKPLAPVWSRLVLLAGESLSVLEKEMMRCHSGAELCQVFLTSVEPYDVVLKLNRGMVARRLYNLEENLTDSRKKIATYTSDGKVHPLPVFDYEPVDCFIEELRTAYGDKARFFYDSYGGTSIGVQWIDKAWTPVPFKVSLVNGCSLKAPSGANEQRLEPNLMAICQDFLIMGQGLVKKIQSKDFELEASDAL